MGQPPKSIYKDGEAGIMNNGFVQKYLTGNNITFHYTRGHPAFAERYIGTFKSVLEKRIKPRQQWTELIYPILMAYKNNLMHSATEMTPQEANKQERKNSR